MNGFIALTSLMTGAVGILLSMITFPTVAEKAVAVTVCALACGVIWQAFRERISRTLTIWLLCTAAAAVLLIYVRDGVDRTGEAVAGTDPAAVSPTGEPSATPSVDPSSSKEPERMWLDSLPVVDGGQLWSRDEKTIHGQPYDHSLTAPACHSASISYNIGNDWSMLTVVIGVPDDSADGSQASFRVVADNTEIYNSDGDLGPGDRKRLELNVRRVFRLTLRSVTSCTGDHVGVWANPVLIR